MARKLRVQEEGGLYHIINRGNYRSWVFRAEGAKVAFEQTLFEACERAGWVLHAYCIMGNHYHLALETPNENLSEGMRWLQSVFANRFNRYRKASGHLFQGRYKSLLVGDGERLAWLCHYIHLNPVRAGICRVDELPQYRWTSLRYLTKKKSRPKFLDLGACLNGAGELADSRSGWNRYLKYLAWLNEDEPARKQMNFEKMSKGWVLGTRKFQKAAVADEKQLKEALARTAAERKHVREVQWANALERAMSVLKKDLGDIKADPKAADWKVAVAASLKRRFMSSNRWLTEQLNMGTLYGVSRYVSEMEAGKRPGAQKQFNRLTARIKH